MPSDWLKNSHHFLIQSEVKPKPIVMRLQRFSRALCSLHAFALSFDWFSEFALYFVTSQCYCLNFVPNDNQLKTALTI